jgi:hypothetical protein
MAGTRRQSVDLRRMSVFVGHFGSGKTEVALGVALQAAERGETVTLVDLDVVKPFFRCRALGPRLQSRGVRILAPDGEYPPIEIPVAPPDLPGLLRRPDSRLLVDVGGDPVGALTFGAVAEALPREELDLLLVLNFFRARTDSVEGAVTMARAIAAAARLPLTGVVANNHLLGETTPATVREGLLLAEQTAEVLGVPVRLVAVEERLIGAFPPGFAPCPVLPLRRLVYPPFGRMEGPRTSDPPAPTLDCRPPERPAAPPGRAVAGLSARADREA